MEIEKDVILNHSVGIDGFVGSGIYFLIKNNSVVYVGQTRQGIQRVLTHLRDKEFDSYYFYRCEDYLLDQIEIKNILKYNPKYNKSIASLGYITLQSLNKSMGLGNIRLLKRLALEYGLEPQKFGGRDYYNSEQRKIIKKGLKLCQK